MKTLGHVDITDRSNPYGKAIGLQRRLLLNPRSPRDIIYYAALCLLDQQFAESEYWLKQCLEKWPGDTEALYHLSLVHLFNGDYHRGFELYEHRFTCYEDHFRGPPLPRWEGQPTDQPVILWQEGGYGDAILPARWLPEVGRRCKYARLFCQESITSLLQASGLCDTMHWDKDASDRVAAGDALQSSLMSLPFALKLGVEDINGSPYLQTPRDVCAQWRKQLVGASKIGFCWSGNPTWERDATRSMPLAAAQLLQRAIHVTPVVQEYTGAKDWLDTAAILANFDLVISTCTSIAHCAAALGIPTWILLSFDHDWRWGRQPAHSWWYDSVRLFRQPKHGDWGAVIEQVYNALRNELQAQPTEQASHAAREAV